MEHATIIALRIVHIVMGSFWVGSVVFTAVLLMPAMGSLPPSVAGPVMDQLIRVRNLPRAVMTYMGLTILSGLGLMYMVSGHFQRDWFQSRMGHGISIGAALAIIGSLIGVLVNKPTSKRMNELGAQMKAAGTPSAEQSAEMGRLQARMMTATRWTAVLLGLAAAAMASARYL